MTATGKPSGGGSGARGRGGGAAVLDVVLFTFGSLYFSGIKLETFRGPVVRTAVNDFYMPLIESGWSVPLAFVADVCALLLSRGATFASRWKQDDVPADVRDLAADYHRMLVRMRRDPQFQRAARLAAAAASDARRYAAVSAFVRFLVMGLAELREAVPFSHRRLEVRSLRPRPDGIDDIVAVVNGARRDLQFRFVSARRALSNPVVGVVARLMRRITDYFAARPPGGLLSAEEMFVVEYAARGDGPADRLDYHMLQRLLASGDVPPPDAWPPLNTLVEDVHPTDNHNQDGRVGGYIDVNLKRASEALGEVLPSEFALRAHPPTLYHKLINEGALHYIREDVEQVEPEVRVLVYVVVDGSPAMHQAPPAVHPRLAASLTPSARARALAADVVRDLVRYVPRQDVRADVVLYRHPGHRDQFDLFRWDPARAADPYQFATDLAEAAPAFFHYRLGPGDQPPLVRLDPDPWQNSERSAPHRRHHCRHLVLVTSGRTMRGFLPTRDLRLACHESSRDSAWVLLAETSRLTVGVLQPVTPSAVAARAGDFGQLTEERARARILDAVLLKLANRRPRSDAARAPELTHG